MHAFLPLPTVYLETGQFSSSFIALKVQVFQEKWLTNIHYPHLCFADVMSDFFNNQARIDIRYPVVKNSPLDCQIGTEPYAQTLLSFPSS